MIKSISKPFTALATYLRHKRQEDPFLYARYKTAILYFFSMFATVTFVNQFLDTAITGIVSHAFEYPGTMTSQEVSYKISQYRWIARCFNLTVFTTIAYLLLGLTLKPIKDLVQGQKRFIANVSHELRTPLTIAKAEIEIALRSRESLTREEAITLLENSVHKIDHISRIVQFFLVLSDFNSKHAYAAQQPVVIEECIRSVHEHIVQNAQKKNVSVVLDLKTEDSVIKGNSIAVEKMILNLVHNAVAYSNPGGIVVISTKKDGGNLIMLVSDTGIGIPDEDKAQIFEAFYRGSNARPEGSGLGLSIVKEVARIHNATVKVRDNKGKGTIFSVAFPYKQN